MVINTDLIDLHQLNIIHRFYPFYLDMALAFNQRALGSQGLYLSQFR